MDVKKSVKADLEWRKPMFFQIGLVISLLVIYMAFEFVRASEGDGPMVTGGIELLPEDIMIQTQQDEAEVAPPTPPAPMVESLMEIVSDAITVADFSINVESDQHLAVEDHIVQIVETVEEVKEAEVFVVVEVLPEFTGGDEARQKFLQDNLVYPCTVHAVANVIL